MAAECELRLCRSDRNADGAKEAHISDDEMESERRNEDSPAALDSPNTPPSDFPFPGATNESVIQQMWAQLPSHDRARHLSDKYFEYDSCL